MSIIVLQTFVAAEGRYEELTRTIAAMLTETASRAGAEFMHAAGDAAANSVTVYEQWDGPENLKAYTAWRMEKTDVSGLVALLGAPPKIQQLAHVF